MAFISLNTRVVEHRTRLVCLGETPSPRVRCRLALITYLLTTYVVYLLAVTLSQGAKLSSSMPTVVFSNGT